MSLIFIDGFDHYNFIRAKWQAAGTFDNPTFVDGRFGGQAVKKQFQNSQQSIARSFPNQESDVTFGIALKTPGFSGFTQSFFRLEDVGGVAYFSVNVTASGNIQITAGGQVVTSTLALDNVQWNYIEAHWIPKDAAGKGGVAEVKVNGLVWIAIDGTQFPTTLGADDDIGGFGFMDDGTNSPRYLFDDLYILNSDGDSNNTYLGDVRITTLFAAQDGTVNDWSPDESSVTNAQAVDETLMDNNVTYVESGLIGAAEDYDNQNFATVEVAPGQIFGVQVANATLRTATGTIDYKNEMVIAGTRYSDDVEYQPGSGSVHFVTTYIRDTDPSDGGTWTEDKVSNVNSGIVITAKEDT